MKDEACHFSLAIQLADIHHHEFELNVWVENKTPRAWLLLT